MCTFLGIARVDFPDKDTGELIQGWSLWLAEPLDAPSSGLQPVKKWLKDDQADRIFAGVGGPSALGKFAGCQVEVEMGLRGQISGVKFPQK